MPHVRRDQRRARPQTAAHARPEESPHLALPLAASAARVNPPARRRSHCLSSPPSRQALRGARRGYGVLSDLGKKTHAAASKAKAAAEELGAGRAAAELRERAAAAQALARGTVEELLGQGHAGAGGSGKEQQQWQQREQPGAGAKAERPEAGPSAGAPPPLGERVRGLAAVALAEMRAAVLPQPPTTSALRGAAPKASDIPYATTSELALPRGGAADDGWGGRWRSAADALRGHPLFRRVAGGLAESRVATASREAADALRERWDTSDSPLVHRIQDAADALGAEGEGAAAARALRAADPAFDMVIFLAQLKADVPVVLRAYLTGDAAALAEHCSPEMVERLAGVAAAQAAAGATPDPTLLDVSDVELVDLKLLDDRPVVVAQFSAQQINCVRDAAGNVVEGAPDDVHRVYYYWALQQEEAGYVGADGALHPPRWRLREMLVRGMHHLL